MGCVSPQPTRSRTPRRNRGTSYPVYNKLDYGLNKMPINFEIPEHITQQMQMVQMAAEYSMRPVSRELDEHEHDRPTQFVETMWPFMRDMTKSTLDKVKSGDADKPRDPNRPRTTNLRLMLM